MELVPSTKDRIEALREEGFVPYSSFTTRCAVLVIGILSVSFLAGALTEVDRISRELLSIFVSEVTPSIPKPFLSELWKLGVMILLIPALMTVVGAFLIGLVQTKFYLRRGRSEGGAPQITVRDQWGWRLLVAPPIALLSSALVGAIGAIFWPSVLSLLTNGTQYPALWIQKTWEGVAVLIGISALVFGILSWIVSRITFISMFKSGDGRFKGLHE